MSHTTRGSDPHRDILERLPPLEDCCTPAEILFWNQTRQMAMDGARPRDVANFAATGLDDPLLTRAYHHIRETIRKWAMMDQVWMDWDSDIFKPASKSKPIQPWTEPVQAALDAW